MQECILSFGHQKHNSQNNYKFILPGLCLVSSASCKFNICATSFYSQKDPSVDNELYSALTIAFAHSEIFCLTRN